MFDVIHSCSHRFISNFATKDGILLAQDMGIFTLDCWNGTLGWVWIAMKRKKNAHFAFFLWVPCTIHGTARFGLRWKGKKNACLCFFCGSCELFMGLASTDFSKFFFKTRSYGTIHTFKNYFLQRFQFSVISGIQTVF